MKPQNEKDTYGLRYSLFVVPLVKAVQEQQKEMEQQDAKIKNQEEIKELRTRLAKLEAMLSQKPETATPLETDIHLQGSDQPQLKQNQPNPSIKLL